MEQYICWDIYPDIGSVLFAYQGIDNKLDCRQVGDRAVFAPTPVPGPYGVCKAAAAD